MKGTPRELDFGIMCEGEIFDDWMAECILNLLNEENTNLKLLIIDKREVNRRKTRINKYGNKIKSLYKYWRNTNSRDTINHLSWEVYKKITRSTKRQIDAQTKKNLSNEIKHADRMYCEVHENGFSEYFKQKDIKQIKEYDLDFILRDAFGIIRGEILEVPNFGVWSFHHDDERKYRGGPPCLWELLDDRSVTGAILQRLTNELDAGIILKRGQFRTQNSWTENINHVYYGTVEWPAQVVTDILNGNDDYVEQDSSTTTAKIYRKPSIIQLLHYNIDDRLFSNDEPKRSKWNIGIIQSKENIINTQITASDINWFSYPKRNSFVADPFPIKIDGEIYIFVEEYFYKENKGKISYIQFPDGYRNGVIKLAHEEPVHMSYPYVFKNDSEIYAIPEVYKSGEIRLYRLNKPDDWEMVTTLVTQTKGVDPTIINYEGRWWMFFTKEGFLRDEERYNNTKLFIYYSDSLKKGWEPHENNPVKTNVNSSRPGGTPILTNEGELYRPSQCCADTYGQKVIINKVTCLTNTNYSEKEIKEIRPYTPYPDGLHTVSQNENLIMIDGKKHQYIG